MVKWDNRKYPCTTSNFEKNVAIKLQFLFSFVKTYCDFCRVQYKTTHMPQKDDEIPCTTYWKTGTD